MLQLERGVFKISRQTNDDETGADIRISVHSPREGQISPLTYRESTQNTGGGDALAQVSDEKVILDLCGNVGATSRMSGKGDPGFDVLRRRKCVIQATNLGLDAEFHLNRPEGWLSNHSSAHRQIDIRKRLRHRCSVLSQHTISICNRHSTVARPNRFVTKPPFLGRVAFHMRHDRTRSICRRAEASGESTELGISNCRSSNS